MLRADFQDRIDLSYLSYFRVPQQPKLLNSQINLIYPMIFAQQFKRSVFLTDPVVKGVALSPRGILRIPLNTTWQVPVRNLEKLDIKLIVGAHAPYILPGYISRECAWL